MHDADSPLGTFVVCHAVACCAFVLLSFLRKPVGNTRQQREQLDTVNQYSSLICINRISVLYHGCEGGRDGTWLFLYQNSSKKDECGFLTLGSKSVKSQFTAGTDGWG